MIKKYQDEQWLREQYWGKGLSLQDMATMCNCDRSTISYWLKKYGIRIRSLGNGRAGKYKCERWLRAQYLEKELTQVQIAELCDCSRTTICYWMGIFNIPHRSRSKIMLNQWECGVYDERDNQEALYRREDWLRKQYLEEKRNLYEIAEICDVSAQTILNWMENFGIERRDTSEVVKMMWENGVFDSKFTEEVLRKMSIGMKRAWKRGDFDSVSESRKQDWASGVYDGVFRSPSSLEIVIAQMLDSAGVKHQCQYRPPRYRRVYDEFIPPNFLIEIHGDYWHGPLKPDMQKRDVEKAEWAKKNGYHLIVLWEHEINEIGAWPLVKNRVLPFVELSL